MKWFVNLKLRFRADPVYLWLDNKKKSKSKLLNIIIKCTLHAARLIFYHFCFQQCLFCSRSFSVSTICLEYQIIISFNFVFDICYIIPCLQICFLSLHIPCYVCSPFEALLYSSGCYCKPSLNRFPLTKVIV